MKFNENAIQGKHDADGIACDMRELTDVEASLVAGGEGGKGGRTDPME